MCTLARLNRRLKHLLFHTLLQQEVHFFEVNNSGEKSVNRSQGCTDLQGVLSRTFKTLLPFHQPRKSFVPPALGRGQDGPHGGAERQRGGSQHGQNLPHARGDVKPVLGAHRAHLHRDATVGRLAEQIHHLVQGRCDDTGPWTQLLS